MSIIDKRTLGQQAKIMHKSVLRSLTKNKYRDDRDFKTKLRVPWIFYHWIEKVVLVLSFCALLWTIIKLLFYQTF